MNDVNDGTMDGGGESDELPRFIAEQSLAERMVPVVGALYRDRGIIVTVFGRKLMNASTIGILKAHRLGRLVIDATVSPLETTRVLEALERLPVGRCRVDVGALAGAARAESVLHDDAALESFLTTAIAHVPPPNDQLPAPRDVVLYGFGRIGRILARLLIERAGSSHPLRLRAIVVRGGRDGDLAKRASLLRRDSVHGAFNGSITVDEARSAIIANGNVIKVIHASGPEEIDYTAHGIHDALVVDNTGVFKDATALERHLTPAGASKVLLTAPASDVPNIVYGVNDALIGDERIICAASCTTNAITPVLKVVNDTCGIAHGHVETVHSYTNDQNLIDNYHAADRRGRSAPLNMVLTSTGAAKAVAKALPELAGKLTGNAIRVPTPNVSMAVCALHLDAATDRDALNETLRQAAFHSPLRQQIAYSSSHEVVSSDFVGTPEPAIFDSVATLVDGRHATLYVWYDNEYGYTTQVLRVLQRMAGIHIVDVPG